MSGFQASGMCLRGFGLSTAFGRKNHSEKLGQRRNVGVPGDGRGRPAPSVTDMRMPRGPPACPGGDAGTPAAASWPGGSGRRSCRGCGPRRGAVSPGEPANPHACSLGMRSGSLALRTGAVRPSVRPASDAWRISLSGASGRRAVACLAVLKICFVFLIKRHVRSALFVMSSLELLNVGRRPL